MDFLAGAPAFPHFKFPSPLPFYLAHLPWALADITLQLQLTLPVAKGTSGGPPQLCLSAIPQGLRLEQISKLRASLKIRFEKMAEALLGTAKAAIQPGAQWAECGPDQRTNIHPISFKANSF
jgi:hypothetical protein